MPNSRATLPQKHKRRGHLSVLNLSLQIKRGTIWRGGCASESRSMPIPSSIIRCLVMSESFESTWERGQAMCMRLVETNCAIRGEKRGNPKIQGPWILLGKLPQ